MRLLWPRIVAVGALVAGCAVARGQLLILPAPSGPISWNAQRGWVSADGSTVLMWSDVGSLASGSAQPARGRVWSAETGWSSLPVPAGAPWAEAVPMTMSGDGQTFFGRSGGSFFRWSEAGGGTTLAGMTAQRMDAATAGSADGRAFTGIHGNEAGTAYASFRWTEDGGFAALPGLGGYRDTVAMSMSADGSVVVGYGNNLPLPGELWFGGFFTSNVSGATAGRMAFRWTAAGGMQALGEPVAGQGSVATLVSGNGEVVFGYANSNPTHLVRWNAAGEMETLPNTLGAGYAPSSAVATNHDGTVLVGMAHTIHSYIWTESGGFMNLVDYFGANGMDTSGFIDRRMMVTGMSADGLTFAGWGSFSGVGFRPFIATVPGPGGVGVGAAMAWVLARRRRALTAGA